MRSTILAAIALVVFLIALLAGPARDSHAQPSPGVQVPPGAEWIQLSERAALVISDFRIRDGSVEGRLMVELEGQWAPVSLNGLRMLPLQ